MFDFQELNFDMDGDGVADSYAEEMDMNEDGVADTIFVDTNGNGNFDTMMGDLDGDSYTDTYAYDCDENGIPNHFSSVEDTNGDGTPDTVMEGCDHNQDGEIDAWTFHVDTDGDGMIDTVAIQQDFDFDGNMDATEVHMDLDGDGYADIVHTDPTLLTDESYANGADAADYGSNYNYDYGYGTDYGYSYSDDLDYDGFEADDYDYNYDFDYDEFEVVNMYEYDESVEAITPSYYYTDDGFLTIDFENFDPDSADSDAVSGDPADSMEHWEFQGDTNRCALYSQLFVTEELTGQEIDIEDMVDVAEENGWFIEEGGTPVLYMNKMLDHYGVENEVSFNNDIDDLKECLDNGEKVIVSVDANEIWFGDNDSVFAPDNDVNHAVQVIGIDYSNPDEPMVILNDSGNPDGCGEMIPLDVFVDAWEDGNCHMVACK